MIIIDYYWQLLMIIIDYFMIIDNYFMIIMVIIKKDCNKLTLVVL